MTICIGDPVLTLILPHALLPSYCSILIDWYIHTLICDWIDFSKCENNGSWDEKLLESVFLVKKSKLRVSFENSWRWLLQGGHVCLGFLKLLDFLKGKKTPRSPTSSLQWTSMHLAYGSCLALGSKRDRLEYRQSLGFYFFYFYKKNVL